MNNRDLIKYNKGQSQIVDCGVGLKLNYADLWLSVNFPEIIVEDAENKKRIKITNCNSITINLSEGKHKKAIEILRDRKAKYSTTAYPPFYFKGQGDKWNYSINLHLGYSDHVLRLLQWEFSYGKIEIDGLEAEVSHSAGCGGDEGWSTDFTNGWNVIGNRLDVIKKLSEHID